MYGQTIRQSNTVDLDYAPRVGQGGIFLKRSFLGRRWCRAVDIRRHKPRTHHLHPVGNEVPGRVPISIVRFEGLEPDLPNSSQSVRPLCAPRLGPRVFSGAKWRCSNSEEPKWTLPRTYSYGCVNKNWKFPTTASAPDALQTRETLLANRRMSE